MTDQLEKYKKAGYNILCPMTKIDNMSDWHKVVFDVVQLSHNPTDGDVYPKLGSTGQFILTGQALQKLAICASVMWNPKETKATVLEPNYVAYNAVGCIRKADGQLVCMQSEYDIDMRVVEDEIKQGWDGKLASDNKALDWLNKKMTDEKRKHYVAQKIREEINFKRKHKTKLAATGAKNRVIRALLSVKKSYSVAELKKEFVTPRVIVQPDYKDPEVKRAMMKLSLGSMFNVYGPQPAMLEGPQAIEIPPEDFKTVADEEPETKPPVHEAFEDKEGAKKAVDKLEKTAEKREASKLKAQGDAAIRSQKIEEIETEAKRTGFNLVTAIKKPLSEFMDIHLDALLEKLKKDPDDDIPY